MLGILFYISPHALLEVCGFYRYPLLIEKDDKVFFLGKHAAHNFCR
jgi:hypothetical protein